MDYGSNNYSDIRVAVVSWPPGEVVDSGHVRTVWSIETLDEISEEGLRRLATARFDQLSRTMSISVEVLGPRTISMVCVCDDELPDPMRLGAVSAAWRFIDEAVSRIWMIGGRPRCLYPEFMRQRRQLVERLSATRRQLWMRLSLIRCSPVLAVVLGEPIGSELVPTMLAEASSMEPESAHTHFSSRIATASTGCISDDPELKDVGRLWVQALESASTGSKTGSADLMAYATERVFDIAFVLDRVFGTVSTDGLAAAEDSAWLEDCRQLVDSSADDPPQVLGRCGQNFARVADFCRRPAVRASLENVSNI